MASDSLTRQDEAFFDASQFKLQDDGTFRISVRGMASMAGIDHRGLSRSLKSAGDENALPCARSLVLQGFCPGDVSAWSETGQGEMTTFLAPGQSQRPLHRRHRLCKTEPTMC